MNAMEKLAEKEKKANMVWEPNEGDIITGVVAERGSTTTSYGVREFLKLTLKNGGLKIVYLNSSLLEAVQKEAVKRGDSIAIKLLRIKKNGSKKFKEFILAKDDEPGIFG